MACLAIATNGRIMLNGAVQEHLITFLNAVRRMGGEYEVTDDGIAFWKAAALDGSDAGLKPLEIRTDVHPGFMTDWQQPLAVLLTQAHGISTIHETIYEDRFAYAMDLNEMGAKIKVTTDCPPNDPCRLQGKNHYHFATIEGPTAAHEQEPSPCATSAPAWWTSSPRSSPSGVSEVDGVEEIDRGYERIDERLRQLGADITRV